MKTAAADLYPGASIDELANWLNEFEQLLLEIAEKPSSVRGDVLATLEAFYVAVSDNT